MYADQEYNYYYGEQIKNYIAQFAQVFSEMYVTIGKNDYNNENRYVRIPIMYGSQDKVVAAIKSENTQNKPIRLPAFSIVLDDISIMMERMSGTNTQVRQSFLPVGGDIRKDVKVIQRLKPLPYNLGLKVTAYTSNTDQMFQIIEQILLLFDPMLQFQTSDSYFDWAKIIDSELTAFSIDNNRSAEDDGRIVICTFGFDVRAYMSPPANLKDNAINSIRLRIDTVAAKLNTEEYAKDVDREHPEYTIVYDLDKANIPPI